MPKKKTASTMPQHRAADDEDRLASFDSKAAAAGSPGIPARLPARLRALHRLYAHTMTGYLSELGVTHGQWLVLRVLWDRDGIHQREIADSLGMTSGATVFSVNLLERDGLVVRKMTDDKRVRLVFLTNKGRKLRQETLPFVRQIQTDALSGFTEAERASFFKMLDRIESNLNARLARQAGPPAP